MASNSKPAAELRIATVKATIWENEVGGLTHHNVTFFADLPRRGPVEDHSELRFQQPALRCQARRPGTLAHCRAQGRGGQRGLAMTKPHKTTAPSGGGFTPVAFVSGRLSCREDGSSFQRRSVRGVSAGTLTLGRAAKGRHSVI